MEPLSSTSAVCDCLFKDCISSAVSFELLRAAYFHPLAASQAKLPLGNLMLYFAISLSFESVFDSIYMVLELP
jgi:hypothetical protein